MANAWRFLRGWDRSYKSGIPQWHDFLQLRSSAGLFFQPRNLPFCVRIQRGNFLSWTGDFSILFICLSFLCGFFFSFMSCSSVLLLSQQLSFLFFSRYQLCHFFQYLAQIIIPSNDLFFFQNIFSSDCGWYAYESNGGWTQTSQRSTEEEHIGVTLVPKPLHTGNPLISNPFTDVFAIH